MIAWGKGGEGGQRGGNGDICNTVNNKNKVKKHNRKLIPLILDLMLQNTHQFSNTHESIHFNLLTITNIPIRTLSYSYRRIWFLPSHSRKLRCKDQNYTNGISEVSWNSFSIGLMWNCSGTSWLVTWRSIPGKHSN